MSTKIYNAYRINLPLHEFKKRVDSVKKQVNENYKKEVMNELSYIVTKFMETGQEYIIENRFLKKGQNGLDRNGKMRYYYDKEQLENLVAAELDISAPTIMIYVHETGNYCQVFCPYGNKFFRGFIDELEGEGVLSDFHFQNQSDPEVEGMTDEEACEEYNRREAIWEEIMECDIMGTPVNIGFTYNLIETWTYYELNGIVCAEIEKCAAKQAELLEKKEEKK